MAVYLNTAGYRRCMQDEDFAAMRHEYVAGPKDAVVLSLLHDRAVELVDDEAACMVVLLLESNWDALNANDFDFPF